GMITPAKAHGSLCIHALTIGPHQGSCFSQVGSSGGSASKPVHLRTAAGESAFTSIGPPIAKNTANDVHRDQHAACLPQPETWAYHTAKAIPARFDGRSSKVNPLWYCAGW